MTNQNDDLCRTDPGFAERMLHYVDNLRQVGEEFSREALTP